MTESSDSQNDNITLAVFSVLVAVFALSFGDAIIKLLSVGFPLWQIYVIRSLIAIPILLAVIKLPVAKLTLIPKSYKWVSIRSLLLACMWIAYYSALPHINLSVAAAVYYTIPLFITLFSAWFTGDKVDQKSWIAVAIGFIGVLLIVRPDASGFNFYVLLPLVAAILYALAMILTRTKCLHENPKILSLALNVTFIVIGVLAILVLTVWSPRESIKEINPFLLGDWSQLADQSGTSSSGSSN